MMLPCEKWGAACGVLIALSVICLVGRCVESEKRELSASRIVCIKGVGEPAEVQWELKWVVFGPVETKFKKKEEP